jgi:hypothetical protein
VAAGIPHGRHPELQGGGLLRSQGGWAAGAALRRGREAYLGDERVLGSTAFIEQLRREVETRAAPPPLLGCRSTGSSRASAGTWVSHLRSLRRAVAGPPPPGPGTGSRTSGSTSVVTQSVPSARCSGSARRPCTRPWREAARPKVNGAASWVRNLSFLATSPKFGRGRAARIEPAPAARWRRVQLRWKVTEVAASPITAKGVLLLLVSKLCSGTGRCIIGHVCRRSLRSP